MKSAEKKLLKLFNRLASPERDMLLAFAAFLEVHDKTIPTEPINTTPVDIPRPDDETVVAAIKRLKSRYHMLESVHLLDAASMLMTQHVMQGKEKKLVIDELEVLFLTHYEKFMAEETPAGEA